MNYINFREMNLIVFVPIYDAEKFSFGLEFAQVKAELLLSSQQNNVNTKFKFLHNKIIWSNGTPYILVDGSLNLNAYQLWQS